jgi:sulfite reductase alpha subunit-like flavoprotein
MYTTDLQHALEAVVEAHGKLSKQDAGSLIKRLQSENRYIVELWS